MKLLAVCALILGLSLHATSALACGASPEPIFSVDAVSPVDGQLGVVRDVAVAFSLKAAEADDYSRNVLRVRVTRERDGGEAVGALDLTRTYDLRVDVEHVAVWAPETPLDANTRYIVELSITREGPASLESQPVQFRSTFTTSDAASPELRLMGQLRGVLRLGTAPVRQCMGATCGECPIVGERPAVYADLDLPRPQGGFSDHGYSSWVTLDDTTARSFTGPGEGHAPENSLVQLSYYRHFDADEQAHERSVEIVGELAPYVACFGYNVWDAFGHARQSEALCFSEDEIAAAWDGDPADARDAGSADDAADAGGADAGRAGDAPDASSTANMGDATGAADAGAETRSADASAAANGGCSTALTARNTAHTHWLGLAALTTIACARRVRRSARGGRGAGRSFGRLPPR